MPIIQKIQHTVEENAICVFGRHIPISVIKLNIETILMIVLVYWAFLQGIAIEQDNVKITAYLAGRHDCSLGPDAEGHMVWDCTLNTSAPGVVEWPK
jgi:hypothetical protein